MCRERAQDFSLHPSQNITLDSVFEAGQCVSLASTGFTERTERRHVREAGGERNDRIHPPPRVKRGFIVPGTLWCGSGNKAPSYANLGKFQGRN